MISAATADALPEQAARLASFVEARPELEPYELASALALRRTHLAHRAAIVAAQRSDLVAGLRAVERGRVAGDGAVAFLFTGQGSQWTGMGIDLYQEFPVFAAALDEVCGELDRHLDVPLREVMFAPEDFDAAALLVDTRFTQVALFALEVALYRLVQSFGLSPDYLIGHSIGEFAAAYVAGVFSLEDGCRLVAERARLMGALPAGGAMLAIEASEGEVRESVRDGIAIAAVNGPRAVVVSGHESAIAEVEAFWGERERRTTRLHVSHAFHSPLMEPMLDELKAVAESIELSAPRIPIVSNLTGEQLTPEQARSPEYWVRHVRETVRFADGVDFLHTAGVTRFLELGPDGTLTAMAAQCVEDELLFASSLRGHKVPQREAFLGFLGAAHCDGIGVDWRALLDDRGIGRVELPTYAFRRERYWLASSDGPGDLTAAGQSAAEHPLLGAAVRLAGEEGWLFTGRLSLSTHPWLADHAVMGTVLLPGTAFVELALAASRHIDAGGVDDLTLVAPLVLADGGAVALQLTVGEPDEDGRRPINIYSRADDDGDWLLHASGLLGTTDDAEPATFGWPPERAEEVDVELVYDRAAEAGYDYGPAFQGLRRAYRDGDRWYAEVAFEGEAADFCLHPALSDAALHTLLLAALQRTDGDAAPEVPFSFSGVRLWCEGAAALRVRLDSADGAVRLVALDESGAPVLEIEALRTRAVDRAALKSRSRARNDSLFEVEWVEVERAAESSNGSALRAAVLGDVGLDVPRIEVSRHADLEALEQAIADGAPTPAVVLARPDAAAGVHDVTEQTLRLLQDWLASEPLADAKLVLLTDAANLAQAALLGLVRSAASENPLRFGVVGLDSAEASAARLYDALASDEPELALRDGVLYAPRLARASGLIRPAAYGHAWRLGIERKGSLDDLALVASDAADAPLGDGQVRIAVHAAGLNFRDVLIALGMYPGEAELGSEGAGVVVEVGPGVADLEPGDRVMGYIGEAFGSHAITEQRLLVKVPEGWSYAEAASVPTVFLTAWYGLVDVAALKQGERVLVHAAAGGVGMAAVQIARHLGADVFATASPAKWDALRGLGIPDDHIASSRDLEFRERFLDATGGAGMDVVLDSLAREYVDASLGLLPRGGRFVEIGKADVRDPHEVAAKHAGVRYRAFDLMEAGPERIQGMLREVVSLLARGALAQLPIESFDLRRAPDAFRHMREARHVGKIVLTVPQPPDPEGTVLITGGTGGLGALVARHLAKEHGARSLLLTSRRGIDAEGARELVAELAEVGCEARVATCDVADRAQVAGLLAEHRVTAVIHAAGVLDDGVIPSLDEERLRKVMAPKVDGAINLHELTQNLELSEFILFSSVAGTLGSPGQGNYAAANAFLDGLARQRRAQGLPATSLAWGAWQRGMAGALSDADRARAQRLGIAALSDEEGLALLDTARSAVEPTLVPARLDTAALRAQAKAGVLPPILQGLVRTPAKRASGDSLAQRLGGAPESDWPAIVLELVRGHVASVLGHSSAHAIDPQQNFKELGFDSLSAVELRNRLIQATGMRLPAALIFDHPTPAALAGYLCSKVPGAGAKRPAIDEELDKLDGMLGSVSGDDGERERVSRRLRSLLARLASEAPANGNGHGVTDDMIESATESEILALVDEELETHG